MTDMNDSSNKMPSTETSNTENYDTKTANTETTNIEMPSVEAKKSTPVTRKRSTKRKKAPTTFKDAYQVLQSNANALQQQDEPDIDGLMIKVEESIHAYKVCQQRIQAVQQALDATFAKEES